MTVKLAGAVEARRWGRGADEASRRHAQWFRPCSSSTAASLRSPLTLKAGTDPLELGGVVYHGSFVVGLDGKYRCRS